MSDPHESVPVKEIVSPKQVARAIGVSESSLKRWCDQGLIPMTRTPGGHRRLPINGVIAFLKKTGHTLVRPKVLGLPATTTGAGDWTLARGREQIVAALVDGNEEICRQIVLDLYLSHHAISEICDEVLASAFQEIGRLWSCGDAAVYQERRSCGICLRILHELGRAVPAAPAAAPIAIGGTLQQDPYQLATAMAELVLCDNGWRATSLGSMLPAETICEATLDVAPRLVWLSVSCIDDEQRFLSASEMICNFAEQCGAAFAVGGNVLTEELRRQMRYSAFCDTMQHLESFARTLKHELV